MAGDWYYSNGDKVTGPLPAAALRQAALNGAIGPKSLVRQGASGKWHSALKVKGLLDSTPEQGGSTKSTTAASKPVPTAAVQDGVEEVSEVDSGVEIEVVEVADDSWDDPDFGVDDRGTGDLEPDVGSFVVPRRPPNQTRNQTTSKKAAENTVHPAVWAAVSSICTLVIAVPLTWVISGIARETAISAVAPEPAVASPPVIASEDTALRSNSNFDQPPEKAKGKDADQSKQPITNAPMPAKMLEEDQAALKSTEDARRELQSRIDKYLGGQRDKDDRTDRLGGLVSVWLITNQASDMAIDRVLQSYDEKGNAIANNFKAVITVRGGKRITGEPDADRCNVTMKFENGGWNVR